MQRPLGVSERLPQTHVGGGLGVVAIDKTKLCGQLGECSLIDAAIVLQRLACARAQLVERPSGASDADNRHVELAVPDHRLQRRKDFLVGQITGRAEENKSIRLGRWHLDPASGYRLRIVQRQWQLGASKQTLATWYPAASHTNVLDVLIEGEQQFHPRAPDPI